MKQRIHKETSSKKTRSSISYASIITNISTSTSSNHRSLIFNPPIPIPTSRECSFHSSSNREFRLFNERRKLNGLDVVPKRIAGERNFKIRLLESRTTAAWIRAICNVLMKCISSRGSQTREIQGSMSLDKAGLHWKAVTTP